MTESRSEEYVSTIPGAPENSGSVLTAEGSAILHDPVLKRSMNNVIKE
jgi:hypothetical protein